MSEVPREGDVLAGKYRVNRVLGVGGMGVVVEATHIELEQQVALKFMLPEAMQSQHAIDRFLREAKACVMLRNEHVCRVLDVGKLESGAPYIVMEFMDGHDLAELLRKHGPLPVQEAVDYTMQALEGVAEAHAKRIVHRDLKPGNLFVTSASDGSPLVKVLDFGISKTAAAGSATKSGDVLGSPSYMAPEQMLSSKNVDARADVWAFGVILYEAVTGQLPFTGDSLPALCMSVIHDEPLPPTHHRPDLDPAFDAVILRCLDKRLDKRFPDISSLAQALAPFGGPSAVLAAGRIGRMHAKAMPSTAPAADGLADESTRSPSPSARPGAISTLQAGAGSLEMSTATAPRRTPLLVVGSAGAILAGLVAFAVVASRSAKSVKPAGMPAVAPTIPAVSPPRAQSEPPAPVALPTTPPVAAPPQQTAPPPAPSARASATAGSASTGQPPPTISKQVHRAAVKAPAPPPANLCTPPYVLDATGKRIYKPECL